MDMTQIHRYIAGLCANADSVNRSQFQNDTELKEFTPVVDDDVARLLQLLIRMTRARRILEIGTSIGYAATSMALIAKEFGGRITTIEFDEPVARQAEKNFQRAGVSELVEVRIGDARQIVPALEGEYDLIFQDVDKRLYSELLEDCIRLLKPGGALVAEDTLFPVIDLHEKWQHLIPPIEDFNRQIAGDARLASTIIPVGDGVTLAVKISD